MQIVKKKSERAPAPKRGNAKNIFAVIADYSDPLTETEISNLLDKPIRHQRSVSAASAFKSSLRYLVTFGYIDRLGSGKGAKYQVSTMENHRSRYEKFEANRTAGIEADLKSEEILPRQSGANMPEKARWREPLGIRPVDWMFACWAILISVYLINDKL